MHVPSQNIQGANLGDLGPTELAMMDLLVLQLSRVQSRVDLSCKSDQHLLQVEDHQVSDLKV
jgi:hypothetical protein